MPEGGNWKDLLKSAGLGDVRMVRHHISGSRSVGAVDPNFQHPEYFTCPIFEAIRGGHTEIVRILVEEGKANPNIMEEQTDETPLEVALAAGKHDIVEYLLSTKKLTTQQQELYQPRQVLVTEVKNTGASTGKSICQLLLQKGHRILFVCTSKTIGDEIVQDLIKLTGNQKCEYIVGDLLSTSASIQSTTALAISIKERFPTLSVIIHNNAEEICVSAEKKIATEDGFETIFMTNYIIPYILTHYLHPLLVKNALLSRVIFLTSNIYKYGGGVANTKTTPFGKDYHFLYTHAKAKECRMVHISNYMSKIRENKQEKEVAINAIVYGNCNSSSSSSLGKDFLYHLSVVKFKNNESSISKLCNLDHWWIILLLSLQILTFYALQIVSCLSQVREIVVGGLLLEAYGGGGGGGGERDSFIDDIVWLAVNPDSDKICGQLYEVDRNISTTRSHHHQQQKMSLTPLNTLLHHQHIDGKKSDNDWEQWTKDFLSKLQHQSQTM